MLLVIFSLFILLAIIYVYYKTYESFEVVTDGETFINRDNSLEDINYVNSCLNIILEDFNNSYNKKYNLVSIGNIDKSYKNDIIIYLVKTVLSNNSNYQNRDTTVHFSVDTNGNIELIEIM